MIGTDRHRHRASRSTFSTVVEDVLFCVKESRVQQIASGSLTCNHRHKSRYRCWRYIAHQLCITDKAEVVDQRVAQQHCDIRGKVLASDRNEGAPGGGTVRWVDAGDQRWIQGRRRTVRNTDVINVPIIVVLIGIGDETETELIVSGIGWQSVGVGRIGGW